MNGKYLYNVEINQQEIKMSDDLYDIRHAIQEFLETKLQGEVHGAGLTLNEPNRQADIEVSLGDSKYLITIEEL